MKCRFLLFMMAMLMTITTFATGEPSTYFQIYVPPNNDPVRRDAALIITAIYDSTSFEIIDDGADGDTDDSKTGMLMAGQSYVLYIRDNGINDDARYASGGVLKWDGDYFIVKSDKLVFASQSTNSDWQHDWVPSTDKKSIGQRFIIYSPAYSSSKRDVNVYAYEPNTVVMFQKISTQSKTTSGYTDVSMEDPVTVFTRTLNPGEDIIDKYQDGRDVMDAGETYMIVANKPVTVQYGALLGNERDGGGYVPSSNGSSAGELFYFLVPFQAAGEQEIRVVSWDDANQIQLERYVNGSWVAVKSFSLNKMKAGDWVGRSDGNVTYSSCFRLKCTAGKRVSVFEGNWFETGSPGTSDMATMVSAENGTTAGTKFLTYMAPPGTENNVIDPFTGKAFGQQLSHLYLFSRAGATVTIKDAYTNGSKISRTVNIAAERYADVYLTLNEWKSIYNGTGTPSGPERPYLLVESSSPIAVMNSNFNDNWMCYTGTSLPQGFTGTSTISQSTAVPSDTITVRSVISTTNRVDNPTIEVQVQDGLKVISSNLNSASSQLAKGSVDVQPDKTVVKFENIPALQPQSQYTVETKTVAIPGDNNGNTLSAATNATVETIVSGKSNGVQQQATTTEVVMINTQNTSKLIFSRYLDNVLTKDSTDSWTVSWVDINKDGYDDIFTTDRRSNKPNLIYMNNKQGGFTKGQSLAADSAISMSNTWADVNNDGFPDLLVLNNTRKASTFYNNNNGILVKDNSNTFTQTVSYYHGGAFADFDNDGKVDLFMCNYFPTKYNELYRNNAPNGFVKQADNIIPTEANQSIGPSWADYDGDGFQDLFVPNGNGFKNSLFHNEGNGKFSRVQNAVSAAGGQSVGSCWGDYDNDGDLDLFVTNSNGLGNFLYRNDGKGIFTSITNSVVVTDRNNSHGCSFADIDNDGDLDLYVSSDKNFKLLYINDGHGNFSKKDDEIVTFSFGNAFGHAWSDFDHDGDLDLLVATHSNQPNVLFTNNGNTNKWIELVLTGTSSNRSAIGADIRILCNGKWQMREVNAQSGFGGQSSFVQHFGTGTAGFIDSIIIQWPGGSRQILTGIATNQVLQVTEPQAATVKGGVYFDQNGDGVKQPGEKMISSAVLAIQPTGRRVYTDNDGYFSVQLVPGNYSLKVESTRNVNGTGSNAASLNVEGAVYEDTLLVPADLNCTGSDLNLVMGGTAIRKGFTNSQFTVLVSNDGRETAGQISMKLHLPSTLLLNSITPAYNNMVSETINGKIIKTYTWNFASLEAGRYEKVSFLFGGDGTVNIGDSIAISGSVQTSSMDCNSVNNDVSQVYKVVGAIDPNELRVSPVGYGEKGYIKAAQQLLYTVRFENKGTHPADMVTISDLLPASLDLSTLKVVATSHPLSSLQVNGREVQFMFNDIDLPDSASDATGSTGYLSFSIRPVAGILPGTEIRNKVSIAFDHYIPLITNDVINTIETQEMQQPMIGVRVFPVPARDVLNFELFHKMRGIVDRQIVSAELIEFSGRTVYRKLFTPKDEYRINIPVQLNGYYILKLTDDRAGVYTEKITVIRER